VCRLDGTELAGCLGGTQQLEVDLDVEDLLHAADVGVPELFVRVEEGTATLGASCGVDHLVAMDTAAPAFDLVLRMKRKLTRRCGEVALGLHK